MTWIVRLLSLSRSESHHHLQSKAAAIQIQMSRYPDIQIQMSVCDSVLLILSICAAFRDCQSKLQTLLGGSLYLTQRHSWQPASDSDGIRSRANRHIPGSYQVISDAMF